MVSVEEWSYVFQIPRSGIKTTLFLPRFSSAEHEHHWQCFWMTVSMNKAFPQSKFGGWFLPIDCSSSLLQVFPRWGNCYSRLHFKSSPSMGEGQLDCCVGRCRRLHRRQRTKPMEVDSGSQFKITISNLESQHDISVPFLWQPHDK